MYTFKSPRITLFLITLPTIFTFIVLTVYKHPAETCVPSSIGISSPTSHWYARLCISFLLKRHPEIALAVKDDSELAYCIWNGVEEVSQRGTDFLSVRSAKERKEYFDCMFGGMCIKRIHYFQLTLNHFIRSVLSKFIWIPYCVFLLYLFAYSLLSVSWLV
jgi:hypothetical protein